MGYVPPRPQRSGESDLEYIQYLEQRLMSTKALTAAVIGMGLVVAIVTLLAWST